MTSRNEAAERLHDALAHFRARSVRIQMIDEALAAERRATVERIQERVDGIIVEPTDTFLTHHRKVLAILDEEATR